MRAEDAAGLVSALAARRHSRAVIDPALISETDFRAVATAAADMDVPLVLVGELTTRSASAYLLAEAIRPTDALFGSVSSINRDWLRFVLAPSTKADVPAMVLHGANVALKRLPVSIQHYTAALFTEVAPI
jgi:hypothetical protein